jgi:hypothetical protein
MATKKINTTKATKRHRWPSRSEGGTRLTGEGVWINAMAYDYAPVVDLTNQLITLCETTKESFDGNAGGLTCAQARRVAKQMNALHMLARLVDAFDYERAADDPEPFTIREQEAAWDRWRATFAAALDKEGMW